MNSLVPTSKPKTVAFAVNLYWVNLALGLVYGFIRYSANPQTLGFLFIPFLLVFFVIHAFINLKISAGRNWARIVSLIMFLLGLPGSIMILCHPLVHGEKMMMVIHLGINAVVLYLLFAKSGSWFHQPIGNLASTSSDTDWRRNKLPKQ